MKPLLTATLVLSLTVNAGIALLLLTQREPASNHEHESVLTPTVPVASSESSLDPATWTSLRPDDMPGLVQRLRDQGFPPHIIRGIAAGQIRENYAARMRALSAESATRPFWKSSTMDSKVMMAQRQLYREQQQELRALLGPDAEGFDTAAIYQAQRFDSVPTEKVQEVRDLLREFQERRMDIYGTGFVMLGAEQSRQIAALEREQQVALRAILTPQEYEEFQLRNGDVARSMRYQLVAFDPSEEEFRNIHRLQSASNEQFPVSFMGTQTPEEQQRRSEARRQLNEQIKAMLGPVRGADYERANDYNYRQTTQLIGRLELPPETTQRIWSVKQEIEERANALRRNSELPAAERTARLGALAEEASVKIAPLLGGSRGFEAYQQYGGGWLRSLAPRPPGTNATQTDSMILVR